MAVVIGQLANEGFRPSGDLIFVGVADEEAGGVHGAGWLCENEWDAVGADYMITEGGGIALNGRTSRHVTVSVAEKGASWRRLTIGGTPGHGSQPFGVDNALIKAAKVIQRLAEYRPAPSISTLWREFVDASDWPADLRSALTDPARLDDALDQLADVEPAGAKLGHACTHTTFSPNVIHGGVKANVIPETIVLEVDVRTLPGQTADEAAAHLRDAMGDLSEDVQISSVTSPWEPSSSEPNSQLYQTIDTVVSTLLPGTSTLPALLVGGTDARYYRARGSVAYGFGLFGENITYSDIASRFHGIDERVDIRSMELTTQALLEITRRFLA